MSADELLIKPHITAFIPRQDFDDLLEVLGQRFNVVSVTAAVADKQFHGSLSQVIEVTTGVPILARFVLTRP
jgi:hypothetical protein